MKKIITYMAVALLSSGDIAAQTPIEKVLGQVETNNTTLQALRDERDAQKLMNKTGVFLDNLEVEFSYLWGSPKDVPGRKDFNISQRFDIATILGNRNKVAKGQNVLLDLQYKEERISLLLETKKILIDLIYINAMRKELNNRHQQALKLSEVYRKKMQQGDANILESNKIDMNLAAVKSELQRLNIECDALLKNLQRLNGGQFIDFNDTDYQTEWTAVSFEDWYTQAETKNPVLGYIQNEILMNKDQIKLNKAMGLPSFSLGYTSELVTGQNYHGVTIGLSVPLWGNKNRVKQAKAALQATESKMNDAKQQFYYRLSIQYNRTKGLQKIALELRNSLAKLCNTSLLQKALDAGQISLLDYLMETELYYNNINQTLLAEKDYQTALAELQAVEL